MESNAESDASVILSLVLEQQFILMKSQGMDRSAARNEAFRLVAVSIGEAPEALKSRVMKELGDIGRSRRNQNKAEASNGAGEGLDPSALEAGPKRRYFNRSDALKKDLSGLLLGQMRLVCFDSSLAVQSSRRVLSRVTSELGWTHKDGSPAYSSAILPARMNGEEAWILRVDRLA